jgi:probable HAF family extracellular repeat protein
MILRPAVFLLLVVSVSVLLTAGGAVSAAGGASEARCAARAVKAQVGGKRVCLRAAQPCLKRFDVQYRRYGFDCARGVLTARSRWIVADLGLVGSGTVTAINERGLVIGERGSRIPQPFLRAFVWHHGRMTDVAPAGSGYSVAVGINNAGQIIGWSCPCPGQRNFLWQNGVLTDLGGLNPVAINGLGQIVGDGDLWVNGVTTDLGDGMAIAINDAGQVVLRDNVAPGDTVVWENGVATHLGALQGFVPYAINAKGQILGQADNASGQLRAFLWDSGVLRDLGSLDGGESTPRAINDSGQVIGQSSFASTARHNQLRAFLWHDGVMRNLGTLGTDSTATRPQQPRPRRRMEPNEPGPTRLHLGERTHERPWHASQMPLHGRSRYQRPRPDRRYVSDDRANARPHVDSAACWLM